MRAAICLGLAACCPAGPDVAGDGTRRTYLDAAFHQDPRWLGADGAYTIDLADGRVLWLFGDSFIATSPAHARTESTMVRNSVAVMDGTDLATAPMTFAWRDGSVPASFSAEDGASWFWLFVRRVSRGAHRGSVRPARELDDHAGRDGARPLRSDREHRVLGRRRRSPGRYFAC